MANCARSVFEDFLAVGGRGLFGLDGWRQLRRGPLLEAFGRVNDHAEAHVGMRESAELSALAIVFAGDLRHHRNVINLARDHIALAAERWHPEAVDDVLGIELDVDDSIRWQMQFVSGLNLETRIIKLPPP